jgi:hypothetical protein
MQSIWLPRFFTLAYWNPTTKLAPKHPIAEHYPVWISDKLRDLDEKIALKWEYNARMCSLLGNIFRTTEGPSPEFAMASKWYLPGERDEPPQRNLNLIDSLIDFLILRELPPDVAKKLHLQLEWFPLLIVKMERPCDLHLDETRREALGQIKKRCNDISSLLPLFCIQQSC